MLPPLVDRIDLGMHQCPAQLHLGALNENIQLISVSIHITSTNLLNRNRMTKLYTGINWQRVTRHRACVGLMTDLLSNDVMSRASPDKTMLRRPSTQVIRSNNSEIKE